MDLLEDLDPEEQRRFVCQLQSELAPIETTSDSGTRP